MQRTSKRVLEVIPYETRGVRSKLRSDTSPSSAWVGRADSKTVVQHVQLLRERGDGLALLSVPRPKLTKQTLNIATKVTQPAQLTLESASAHRADPSMFARAHARRRGPPRTGAQDRAATSGIHSVNVIHRPSWQYGPGAIALLGNTAKPDGPRNASTEISRSSHARGSLCSATVPVITRATTDAGRR